MTALSHAPENLFQQYGEIHKHNWTALGWRSIFKSQQP